MVFRSCLGFCGGGVVRRDCLSKAYLGKVFRYVRYDATQKLFVDDDDERSFVALSDVSSSFFTD